VGRGGATGWKKKEWAVAGPKAEENYFRIKFEFLNIQRLWKFAQGDLGGILTRGFLLNSPMLLNDFRKNEICQAMLCNLRQN
jgi:hypothetical protein